MHILKHPTSLILTTAAAIALTACTGNPVQFVQNKWNQAVHSCPPENIGDTIIWSHDNTKIAYTSDRSGSIEVFSIDVNTQMTKQVTHSGGGTIPVAWSPDGSQISIFKSSQLNVIDTAGS